MKKILAICAIAFAGFAIGCEHSDVQVQQTEEDINLQKEANRVMSWMHYIKDPRTGICYAHYRAGYGEVLATVPCDEVPSKMLTVAK